MSLVAGQREEAAAPIWASRLLILAVILLFTVSPMALGVVGVKYDMPDGPFWQKLHPSTFLAALAIFIDVVGRRYPLRRLRAIFAGFPAAMYFIVIWILLVAHGLINQHAQLTNLIEPYLTSLVALFMIDEMPQRHRNFLRWFLHIVICLNATIGVVEYATHARLFPYVIGGVEVDGDYRSTALIGHPLLNASTTGAYILCLVLGGDSRMTPIWRALALLVTALGMVAFGGRTAIAASSIIIVGLTLKRAAEILLGARFDIRHALAGFVLIPLVLSGVAGAAQAGAFDAFISRYVDDNGSGEARMIALQLFDVFDLNELLIGPRQDVVNSALNLFGIEIGIENTWLAWLFQFGAWMAGFFIIGLFALFYEFWRRSRRGATLLFLYFIVIISSAIGLAAKTLIFGQFSMLLLVLFACEDEPSASH